METNEMRERLIEVLCDTCHKQGCVRTGSQHCDICEAVLSYEIQADALIEAGVILPKFKVGQEVWYRYGHNIFKGEVTEFQTGVSETIYFVNDKEFGNVRRYESELFTTQAEAEARLREIKGEQQ